MNAILKNTLLAGMGALWACCAIAQSHFTSWVNPFIGTGENGHTFPGACVPFGLVQTSPVTGAVGWRYCSEYQFGDNRIWGFTQTHLNGTGCTDLGDLLMMPVTARKGRKDFKSHFEKASETARPGYYKVFLDETGVGTELTATAHVAFHRYQFEKTDSAAVLLDLQHGPAWNEHQMQGQVKACKVQREDEYTLSGWVKNSVWVNQDIAFVLQFNRPMREVTSLPMKEREKGQRLLLHFDLQPGDTLLAKVAVSSATVEGARRNLKAELPHWNFESTMQQADRLWNQYLSRIEVEGTDEQKASFYTSFYHALIQPNNIADVDGTYRDALGNLAKSPDSCYYSTFSTWDTYRAAHPFYTLAVPEKVSPFVRSMVSHADAAGFLPVWTLWGKENYCMIGNHSIPIIVEAYRKGFRDFDVEKAFAAIERTLTVPHGPKAQWDIYLKYGYFPYDLVKSESVSRTLESAYDDYAAAVMAKSLGKKAEEKEFARRADFYKNLFDRTTGFMRPKKSDGTWKTPFQPDLLGHAESVGGDYTEGNAWQYTWHVQHDVPNLIRLMGGRQRFIHKLDTLFTSKLESTLSDVTGLIGQYAHGNEPSHHVAYLYTLAGAPERTQEVVRAIFNTQYHARPDGLCGNDDCGQMSAWYMFSAMGFYPVDPVSATYVFGAPQLPKMVLHLPDDKTFTIVSENLSKEHLHVDRIYLNGKRYKQNYLRHEDIVAGGSLVFKMK